MAFDYGTRRIGVAVGQTVSRTATALTVLPAKDGLPQWPAVQKLIDDWRPDVFVVGMPATADGRPAALKDSIERFARKLTGRYGLAVEFVDEHLSSWAASPADVREAGVDAGAAKLILETWFGELAATA